MVADVTPEPQEDGQPPVEDAGSTPFRLLGGRSLYTLPWTGVSLTNSGPTFTAREWAKRKRAKKAASASLHRNRR